MSETNIRPKAGVCRCLRSRMMYLPDQDPDPYTHGFDLNEVGHQWCQKTLRVIGPDDSLVSESDCGPERDCFQGF